MTLSHRFYRPRALGPREEGDLLTVTQQSRGQAAAGASGLGPGHLPAPAGRGGPDSPGPGRGAGLPLSAGAAGGPHPALAFYLAPRGSGRCFPNCPDDAKARAPGFRGVQGRRVKPPPGGAAARCGRSTRGRRRVASPLFGLWRHLLAIRGVTQLLRRLPASIPQINPYTP